MQQEYGAAERELYLRCLNRGEVRRDELRVLLRKIADPKERERVITTLAYLCPGITVVDGKKNLQEDYSIAHLAKEVEKEDAIERYLPFVYLIAKKVHRHLPPGVDIDSLINSGIVGLLEALKRYVSYRGVAFQTYARYRIHGEIIDYLRSLDWVSRSVRAWGRKVKVARSLLTGRLGREATYEEMAAELGVPLERYYRIDQKVSEAMMLSLEDLSVTSEEEWEKTQEEFSQQLFQDPLNLIERKDLVEKLLSAMEELSERERVVICLYYHEELTLREIGEILGLTEGRISQIHTQAIYRLRQNLEGGEIL